ncbi:molybdopterin-dependent oxidoreductase [Telmatospirillum sp.]|uniref:molybdopterin-dependent oxidoreductase n=1 Tax=Telmatospirillum sp. TaxID=2079197 RepID=UPI002846F20C|nr:molybdopterin-dependent oxidoreductase [Telmatospirillum sp.]MDR3437923.1 molybdopterin-dependent oxidoreductase [Telmatospirillum sp.]
MKQLELKRRDFLKATAVTGIGAALGSSIAGLASAQPTKTAETSTIKIVKTNCRSCTADCGVLAHVRDGRVIKLEGNPEFERSRGALCAKGLSGIQALYHPSRNKYPMKRVGARGENKWMRVSWDQALNEIAAKLMEIREKYGAEAVLGSTGGGGNPNFLSCCRFSDVFGSPNWFEPGCAQCYMPRQMVYQMMYGGGPTGNPSLADSNCLELYFYDEIKVKTVVLWATDPSYSGPAQAGRAINELRARGVQTIVIDPRFTPDAAKAEIWLPIRPGTDVALMLAWIRYILDKKLYDADFVMKWTNLPFLVNAKTKMLLRASDLKAGGDANTFVVWDKKTQSAQPLAYPWDDSLEPVLDGAFTVGGVECKTGFRLLKEKTEPFTLAKAAEICWLDADMIEKAIKLYGENTPSSICLGVATDQNANSTQAAMGTATLDMLMGNVEKPGTIMQRYEEGDIGNLRSTMLKKFLSEEQLNKRLGGIEHKGLLRWWAAQPTYILEAMTTGKPYRLRAWIERSGNKLGTVANASAWIEGMKQLELIVQMFVYPTSFSAYADYLLPANEWLETDFMVSSYNRMFARQAVTHLWETMNETWFWARLAKKCAELGHENCKKAFDPKETAPELPYYDTYEEQMDGWSAYFGMTWAEYKAKMPFEFNSMERWRRFYVYKETDPKTGKPKGFGTQSKKCEIYAESMIILGRTGKPWTTFILPPASKDYEPLPHYVEPPEGPNTEGIAAKYPLVMTNGRLPIWHHTTLRNIPYLREIFPVAEIWINPVDASASGVSPGDWVWVESPRGKIRAKARVTQGMARGVVYMERFWNPETVDTETHGWQEMNVNVLSKNSAPFNDVCGTYTLRGYQVRVSKADGPPAGVWLKPEDFKPWLPQPSDPTKLVEL